jgi:AraC family transcriptional regulator
MNKSVNLPSPRFETGRLMLVAGLQQHHTQQSSVAGIPAQWTKFMASVDKISDRVGNTTYGIVTNASTSSMDYLCGVEVPDFSDVPPEYTRLNLPAARYVVFPIKDHISAIQSAWAGVWNTWFPTSGYAAANGPPFEKYGEAFNPKTGLGGYELWVPVVEKR